MDENIWKNRQRKQQVINYTGLARGKITPCDIDGVLEWKNMGYILYEAKYKDAPMPEGQKIMYIRMADDWDRAGKPTLFMVCEHDVTDPEKDVDLANCKVRQFYYQGQFGNYDGTAKELGDEFIEIMEKKRRAKWQREECSPRP